MAEWSHLPRDLLYRISLHLSSSIDTLRFRSVCSTWRSSVNPPPDTPFPILPHGGIATNSSSLGFHLSKRTFYLLTDANEENSPIDDLYDDHNDGWIIKLEQDHANRKLRLLDPLTGTKFGPPNPSEYNSSRSSSFGFSPPTSSDLRFSPLTLDLFKMRVYELCQEYVLQYVSYHPLANSLSDNPNLYMEKVVFAPSSKSNGFTLLTIHISGRLAIFKSRENNWNVVADMSSPFDDVAFYDGRFYAVDSVGRIVTVDIEDSHVVDVVTDGDVFDGDKKYLVASSQGGRLLLVDKHLSPDWEEEFEEGVWNLDENGNGPRVFSEQIVKFKVFELDDQKKKWVEVRSLGDEVLFLGENSAFSALSNELHGCKRNCIYFTNILHVPLYTRYQIGVFDLETGIIEALSDIPGPFWPPPAWVTSTRTGVQNNVQPVSQ